MRDDSSVNIQEMWLAGNELIFVFERSEWHGSEDNTVNISEYRYYLDNGLVIREMNRSAIRQKGGNLDISEVSHQVNDDFEPEYGKSLFDDKKTQTAELIKTAQALSGQGGSPPDLLSWPYRLMLETLSPDAKYAFAWGIKGVASPDWLRWERERYEYLTALGDPGSTLHLAELATGNSLGQIQSDFDPGGNSPYFWAKWSESSAYFVTGSDFRWATGSASIHRVVNGSLAEVADLAAALSTYSIEALRQADHPYAIDATQSMWQEHSDLSIQDLRRDAGFAGNQLSGEGPNHPVYYVSYEEAVTYCQQLTTAEQQMGKIPPGYVYRLPTEAEWEYACRAGSTDSYIGEPWDIGEIAGYNGSVEVGSKKANAFGVFDMQGNIWEWCQDFYTSSYEGLSTRDPRGVSGGTTRVFRGGSWMEEQDAARPSARGYATPEFKHRTVGFRVALGKE